MPGKQLIAKMTPECTERCEYTIKLMHHLTTFINQRHDDLPLIDIPCVLSLTSLKLGSTNNKTPHLIEKFYQRCIRQMSYQEALASSFNNTHQQMQQCQIAITSFKINKPHNVIDYTNNPIVRQQSNKNMPYNQTDHANLVKNRLSLKLRSKSN